MLSSHAGCCASVSVYVVVVVVRRTMMTAQHSEDASGQRDARERADGQ